MRIAVPKEIRVDERRVALVPDVVAHLAKEGLEVWVEAGAGEQACYPDAAFAAAGARIVADAAVLWGEADIVLKVRAPLAHDALDEVDLLHPGSVLIGLLNPLGDPVLLNRLATQQVTSFALDFIPRISRAQSMDALTSQAVVAGYKAVVLAADALGKFFPMLTTAAGTVPPARVLVIGAGVAGLEAIATARRLGAVVEAFDIRPAARDEVQSLGATFIELRLEEEAATSEGYAREVSEAATRRVHEVLAQHARRADVVITTAQVPGKRAPVLLTADMVEAMSPGSVIIDLAAEQGGNCALTKAGTEVLHRGVKILGPVNVPSSLPIHASQMYARNVAAFLRHLLRGGVLHLDFDDQIIASCCVTHGGKIRHERLSNLLGV
ncbi:MAG TPA: Re/Si-specific NAD(P)(+) transhydrogenase subunit alpha [Alphaproteobacteria bacterium]|nr:Re/Si-specific NAD(P)(+) transhydrogenase subunit alpha [Alphaproteobacteria bacterium]